MSEDDSEFNNQQIRVVEHNPTWHCVHCSKRITASDYLALETKYNRHVKDEHGLPDTIHDIDQ